MVGILVSFWDGLFSGAMLVSGSVYYYIILASIMEYPKDFHHCSVIHLVGVLRRCWLKHVDVVGQSACNIMFFVNLS